MKKVEFKNLILTFLFIITLFFTINRFVKNSFANSFNLNNDNNTEWNVKIKSDTKDITSKETKEIKFKVEENENVARGKMAPGSRAIAVIDLDLIGTKYDVDICLDADKNKLPQNFKLSANIDNEIYEIGNKLTLRLNKNHKFDELNGRKKFTIILDWEDSENNNYDTLLLNSLDKISVPITVTVEQHI